MNGDWNVCDHDFDLDESYESGPTIQIQRWDFTLKHYCSEHAPTKGATIISGGRILTEEEIAVYKILAS